MMWAAYIVVGRAGRRSSTGASPGSASGLAIGAVGDRAVRRRRQRSGLGVGDPAARRVLLVGVFSNAIGYGIDQHVLRRIPVRRFALLLALLPVTAMLVGFARARPDARRCIDLRRGARS